MPNQEKAAAKDLVLSWVRSKNQDMQLPYTPRNPEIISEPMLGLQELLIALESLFQDAENQGKDTIKVCNVDTGGRITFGTYKTIRFDLTKNLHNQEPKFYEDISPLLPHSAC